LIWSHLKYGPYRKYILEESLYYRNGVYGPYILEESLHMDRVVHIVWMTGPIWTVLSIIELQA